MSTIGGDVDIFVPGRLCVLGEHTDWSAEYAQVDADVPEGYTLVCATNEGIYARCSRSDEATLQFVRAEGQEFRAEFSEAALLPIAREGGFWAYVAGTAVAMLRRFPQEMAGLRGARIHNHRTTLPLRKGLSSSAAVCVLVVRALAALSEPPLALSTRDTMALAYDGESLTPSGCGRMDQCVAIGRGAVALMTFAAQSGDGQLDVQLQPLRCGTPLHFVVCDVAGSKDTVAILRDLRSGLREPRRLPNATAADNDSRASFLRYARDVVSLAATAAQAVREGDAPLLARCMREAQGSFDDHCAPLCPQELAAPRLHALIAELQQQAGVLAAKGVGSQGDGALQLLCDSEAAQLRLLRHLRDERRLAAFALTVPATDEAAPPAPGPDAGDAAGGMAAFVSETFDGP